MPRGGRAAVRLAIVVAVSVAGALLTVGCLLAGLFELDGFGTPRDLSPRPLLLALYGLGALGGLVIGGVVWRLVRAPDRHSQPRG